MRPVRVPEPLLQEIRAHARDTYPDECCGFLIAEPDPALPDRPRQIVAIQRAANEFEGERRRRFVIRPEELRLAERAVESAGHVIGGFYHSHPDHPARPSTFDEEHAWPWYTYVVLSVTATEVPAIGAFELDGDAGVFREVTLRAGTPAESEVTASLSAPETR